MGSFEAAGWYVCTLPSCGGRVNGWQSTTPKCRMCGVPMLFCEGGNGGMNPKPGGKWLKVPLPERARNRRPRSWVRELLDWIGGVGKKEGR